MLPTCCFPLWGREGVTLQAAAENKRITKKKRISTEPQKKKIPGYPVDFMGELLFFYRQPYIFTRVTNQVNDEGSARHS